VHIVSWWEKLRKGDHLEHSDLDGRIILKWIFEKFNGAWTGSICLRIRIDGGM
jgi:hypothetical protein